MLTIIDLETTGTIAGIHEPVSISMIVLNEDLTKRDSFFSYIRPRRISVIDPEAMEKNQIKLEDLEDAPTSEEVRGTIIEWWDDLGGGDIIHPAGWNYAFDRDFLLKLFGRTEYDSLFYYKSRNIDSIAWALGYEGSLAETAAAFDLIHKPHDAQSDTFVTWKLLEIFNEKLKEVK